MARLFSVRFQFQNKEHLALVTIRDRGVDMDCQIRYIDNQLNNLISGKQFVFSLLNGLQQPEASYTVTAQQLLNATVDAVAKHIYSSTH